MATLILSTLVISVPGPMVVCRDAVTLLTQQVSVWEIEHVTMSSSTV